MQGCYTRTLPHDSTNQGSSTHRTGRRCSPRSTDKSSGSSILFSKVDASKGNALPLRSYEGWCSIDEIADSDRRILAICCSFGLVRLRLLLPVGIFYGEPFRVVRLRKNVGSQGENLREAEKKEIPSGISVLWYLEHFFSLQSNFHSWSIFFSSTNRKTLRNRGAIVLALTLGHFVPSYDSCNCIALRKPPTWTNPPRDKYLPISRPWEWTIISLRLWICESSPNIPEFDFTFNPRYRSIAKLRSNFIFRSIRKIGYYFPFFFAWKNHRPWKGKKEKKFSISSDATSNRGLK